MANKNKQPPPWTEKVLRQVNKDLKEVAITTKKEVKNTANQDERIGTYAGLFKC